jgi:hypothetical protein
MQAAETLVRGFEKKRTESNDIKHEKFSTHPGKTQATFMIF